MGTVSWIPPRCGCWRPRRWPGWTDHVFVNFSSTLDEAAPAEQAPGEYSEREGLWKCRGPGKERILWLLLFASQRFLQQRSTTWRCPSGWVHDSILRRQFGRTGTAGTPRTSKRLWVGLDDDSKIPYREIINRYIPLYLQELDGGDDGARTRDLRRDRPAF